MCNDNYDQDFHHKLIDDYCFSEGMVDYTANYFTSGANNVIYRLQNDTVDFVVKIGVNPSYRKLHIEAGVLDVVKKITPDLICYKIDQISGVEMIIMPFVEGKHEFVINDNKLIGLAESISMYHDYPAMIDCLTEESRTDFIGKRILPVNLNESNQVYFDRFKNLYIKAGLLVTTLDTANRRNVLVHGDLIPLNILFTDTNSVKIIDWEGARYDEPESDIATLFKGWNLDEFQKDIFLKAYKLPVREEILAYRSLLHYLQVIAWRMTIQLTNKNEDAEETDVVKELENEFSYAEHLLSLF